MENVFSNVTEYVLFRYFLSIGHDNYYLRGKINKLITNNLIHAQLQYENQPTTWQEAIGAKLTESDMEFEINDNKHNVDNIFSRNNLIEILIGQFNNVRFAYEILKSFVPINIKLLTDTPCANALLVQCIKRYAVIVRHKITHPPKRDNYNKKVNNLFHSSPCEFITFLFQNFNISAVDMVNSNNIIELHDVISTADVNLLNFLVKNNYVNNYNLNDVLTMDYLIDCANQYYNIYNIKATFDRVTQCNLFEIKYVQCDIDITYLYINIAEYLFKCNMISSFKHTKKITNIAFANYIRSRILRQHLMDGTYIDLPQVIGDIIAHYEFQIQISSTLPSGDNNNGAITKMSKLN